MGSFAAFTFGFLDYICLKSSSDDDAALVKDPLVSIHAIAVLAHRDAVVFRHQRLCGVAVAHLELRHERRVFKVLAAFGRSAYPATLAVTLFHPIEISF